jgi:general secretion pathway protein G
MDKQMIKRAGVQKSSFTLIELLVVIAIIAILMAIMLPSLKKAQATARLVGCSNNLRQMGVGNYSYTSDYNGFVSCNGSWYSGIAPYIEGGKEWSESTMAPKNDPGCIWSCPEDPSGKEYYNQGTIPAWAAPWAIYSDPYNYIPRKMSDYKVPSAKVYLLGADYRFVWYNANFTPKSLGGRLAERHNGRNNILFVDGHVKSYGYPPLPLSYVSTDLSFQWCKPGYAACSSL